ncbi:hypothetical protein WDW86_03335 [Bdellovibrionota bacterium FG-2]
MDCVVKHDLTFFLGVRTPEIEFVLNHMARYTAGFAGKASIDDQTGRTPGGVIWLAPDRGEKGYAGPALKDFWSHENILFGVLAHEMGHVFGLGHQIDGVMNEDIPANLIRSKKALRVTPQIFRYSRWLDRGETICGDLPESEYEQVRKFLGVSDVIRWSMCITPKRDSYGGAFSELQLEFISKKEIIKRSFDVTKSYARYEIGQPRRSIQGLYYENQVNMAFEYHHATFLDLTDIQYRGTLATTPAMPLIMSTSGPLVQLTLLNGSEFLDFHFFIGNWNPYQPGGIKNSSDLDSE